MFKLYAQKILTKYNKVCIFEKIPHKNYHQENKFWAEWSGISVIQQKHVLNCPSLCRLIFQSLYHTSLISPKQEINEIVNFWNFRKCSQINLLRFLWHFGTPFSNGKNKMKWQGTAHDMCCNGRHLHIEEVNVASRIVTIKMNKMLYF